MVLLFIKKNLTSKPWSIRMRWLPRRRRCWSAPSISSLDGRSCSTSRRMKRLLTGRRAGAARRGWRDVHRWQAPRVSLLKWPNPWPAVFGYHEVFHTLVVAAATAPLGCRVAARSVNGAVPGGPPSPRIADGSVTLAFRRKRRPTVRSGGMTTPVGVLAIDDVRIVTEDEITDETPAGRAMQLAGRVGRRARPAVDDRQLYRVELHVAGSDPRVAERPAMTCRMTTSRSWARLARLDRASTHGPWTAEVLALIAERPAVRAGDLADALGSGAARLQDRRPQAEGTRTHREPDIGYRLSPRGRAWLEQSQQP